MMEEAYTEPEHTDEEIDQITNVVMHEVGGISGYVCITYADGHTEEYTDGSRIREIHTRVLINQLKSDLFPNDVTSCIRQCWMYGLEYPGYYSSSNQTWQSCRKAVTEAVAKDTNVPDNVFAATCDAYFASWYPGYSLYAAVYWNTGWCSGTFYYYAYNG